MKLALVILAAVLLVAGCGHIAAKDPFVGTWKTSDGWGVAIAKSGDTYQATMVLPDMSLPANPPPPYTLTRSGDVFTGTMEGDGGPEAVVFRYSPSSRRLYFRGRGLSRLSDGTAAPSP